MSEHRESMHDSSKFGNTYRLIEQSRDAWGWNWLDDAMQDLKVGVRTLVKSPSFAITATLILTFGIGLNVTLFQMMQVGAPPSAGAEERRFAGALPAIGAKQHHQHRAVSARAVRRRQQHRACRRSWSRPARPWRGDETPANRSTPHSCRPTGSTSSVMVPCTGGCSANRWTRAPTRRRSSSAYTFWHNRLGASTNLIGTTVYIDRKPVTDRRRCASEIPRSRFQRAGRVRADRAARILLSGEHDAAGVE